jgi:hypothetical protein
MILCNVNWQGDDVNLNRWSSQLARTDLGEFLTSKANMALGSSCSVTVRVVSKVLRTVTVPRSTSNAAPGASKGNQGGGGGGVAGSDRGMVCVNFTRKAILTFQHIKGADVLIMGMYVQQFADSSSPMHDGVCVLGLCVCIIQNRHSM